MKTIQIEIPEGKKAEWINGVLTLVDESPKNIMDRIKTFDDACNELGSEHPYVQAWNSIYQGTEDDIDLIDHIAYMKLRIICAALNKDADFPRFVDGEFRYVPSFELYTRSEIDVMDDDEKGQLCLWGGSASSGSYCGLACLSSDTAFSIATARYGSRLALRSKELAEYCGRQFISIWKDFIIAKK